MGSTCDDDIDNDDYDNTIMIMIYNVCYSRNAKRFAGYQLKRDVTQDDITSASCLFCGEAYGSHIEEACRNDDETMRLCVTTFLTELKAFSRSRGW